MPIVRIDDLTRIGIIKDVEDHLLLPNAWTDAKNVRLNNNRVERFLGETKVFDPPTVKPYWLLHVFDTAKTSHWLYAGLTKVYDFTSSTHTEITRAVGGNYSATEDGIWNGGVLGGIPVINNGVDKPQSWSPVSSAQRLVDLPNWPATYTAKVIKPFKNFLIALDVTEGGTRNIHRVRWSHPAVPGNVPSSWDETDATKDAGRIDLSDVLSGGCLDAIPLRDIMIIYKERSTWGMQFVGGRSKMRFFQIFDASGLLDTHCAVGFDEGTKHFAMTGEDLIVHDGQNRKSILDDRPGGVEMRKWLLNRISSTRYVRSFSQVNTNTGECWFCFPESGSDWPNVAVIYNWRENSVYFRDISLMSYIALGAIPLTSVSDTWDSDPASWDSDVTTWDSLTHAPYLRRMLGAVPDSTQLRHMDITSQFNGVSFDSYIERTGLSVFGVDRYGRPISDPHVNKLIKGVWLRASGAPVEVQIGSQTEIDGTVTWSASKTFVPGVDEKVDFAEFARLFGIRFTWPNNSDGALLNYSVDVEPLGMF